MRSNPDDGHNTKLQVPIHPNIGLDEHARQSVVEMLNTLLADEAVLTMKTRSAYWHAGGTGFHDLHTLFNTQCEQLDSISNEIAERVQILGGFAIGSFKDLLSYTRLEEIPGHVPGILHLLADHEAAIRFLREDARRCSEEYEDQGTFDLFVSVIRVHEKIAWILRSQIEPELSGHENQSGKRFT